MTNAACAGTGRVPTGLLSALTTLFAAVAVMAQEPPPPEGGLSLDLDVVAKQLDIARQQIEPRLGATVYDFDRKAIETQPQGDNASPRTPLARYMSAVTMPICSTG
jgi:hypothetical protein